MVHKELFFAVAEAVRERITAEVIVIAIPSVIVYKKGRR